MRAQININKNTLITGKTSITLNIPNPKYKNKTESDNRNTFTSKVKKKTGWKAYSSS